jgi:heme-degrading monooxygenase HmoA
MTQHVDKDTYYAVIFTAKKSNNTEGYQEKVAEMAEFVKTQKGFISMDGLSENKNEITVSYWKTMDDIRAWSMNERHAEAKKGGKEKWYDSFSVRICEVKREYAFGK